MGTHLIRLVCMCFAVMLWTLLPAQAQSTWHVDDDAPNDPGPGDPVVSDPLEDGSPGHPFDAVQEGIDSAAAGDTVLVLDGTYTLNAPVVFPDTGHIELRGESREGVLITCVDEIKNYAVNDIDEGDSTAALATVTGLEAGMYVLVHDSDIMLGAQDLKKITAVDANQKIITFDSEIINSSYSTGNGAYVSVSFPLILCGYHVFRDGKGTGFEVQGCTVENLTIDGNRDHIDPVSFYQCGLLFYEGTYNRTGNLEIRNCATDGLSDLGGTYDVHNIHSFIDSHHNGKRGVHFGNQHGKSILSNCTLSYNGAGGLFLCVNVQYNWIVDNEICYNGQTASPDRGGIEGLTNTDHHNRFERNHIHHNIGPGINGPDEGLACDDNEFHSNIVHDNIGDGFLCGNIQRYIFSNNLVFDNGGYGFNVSTASLPDKVRFFDNTVEGNANGGIRADAAPIIVQDSILWNNALNEIELAGGAVIYSGTFNNVEGGLAGAGNIDADPLFASGPLGDYYLSRTAAGQPDDSPCVDAGSSFAENICFDTIEGSECMGALTTGTDSIPDDAVVDMGFHYRTGEGSSTLDAELACLPSSGSVPFSITMSVTLQNRFTGQTRRIAGRIDVTTAGGSSYSNWKSGWTNVSAGGSYGTSWSQSIPALGSLVGANIFTLEAEDVSPSPYNQPPYPAAGDTDTSICTVTGIAP